MNSVLCQIQGGCCDYICHLAGWQSTVDRQLLAEILQAWRPLLNMNVVGIEDWDTQTERYCLSQSQVFSQVSTILNCENISLRLQAWTHLQNDDASHCILRGHFRKPHPHYKQTLDEGYSLAGYGGSGSVCHQLTWVCLIFLLHCVVGRLSFLCVIRFGTFSLGSSPISQKLLQ